MKYNIGHINLIHILIIGLTLSYIGYKKNLTYKHVYNFLGLLALLIPFLVHRPQLTKINYWNIIRIFHYIIYMPILLYIAYYKTLSSANYNNLFITGIIIIVYHLYKLSGRYKKLIL